MESANERVVQGDEGISSPITVTANEATRPLPTEVTILDGPHAGTYPVASAVQTSEPEPVAAEAAGPEQPSSEPITTQQLRKLRGQYFTVRHIPLEACGHKMDVINEPRHRNCENCFFQWMNFHPQLVSTVDEAWREHGKEFVIKLRGKWFAKMFARYIVTVVALKQEEEKLKAQNVEIQTSNTRPIQTSEVRELQSSEAVSVEIQQTN